jgi:hypothetical protein
MIKRVGEHQSLSEREGKQKITGFFQVSNPGHSVHKTSQSYKSKSRSLKRNI